METVNLLEFDILNSDETFATSLLPKPLKWTLLRETKDTGKNKHVCRSTSAFLMAPTGTKTLPRQVFFILPSGLAFLNMCSLEKHR